MEGLDGSHNMGNLVDLSIAEAVHIVGLSLVEISFTSLLIPRLQMLRARPIPTTLIQFRFPLLILNQLKTTLKKIKYLPSISLYKFSIFAQT